MQFSLFKMLNSKTIRLGFFFVPIIGPLLISLVNCFFPCPNERTRGGPKKKTDLEVKANVYALFSKKKKKGTSIYLREDTKLEN